MKIQDSLVNDIIGIIKEYDENFTEITMESLKRACYFSLNNLVRNYKYELDNNELSGSIREELNKDQINLENIEELLKRFNQIQTSEYESSIESENDD